MEGGGVKSEERRGGGEGMTLNSFLADWILSSMTLVLSLQREREDHNDTEQRGKDN
jgi:hypothetical protein